MEPMHDTNAAPPVPAGGASAPPLLTPDSALFLDFDGTLVDLAATPDAVRPPPELRPLLADLRRLLGGALAIISGRRLESVDRFLAPLRLAGAGLHGAQLRLQPETDPGDPRLEALEPLRAALEARFGDDARVLVEDKGAAIALHYRRAPERGAECEQLLRALAQEHGLDVISGHAVVEARPPGIHKGVGLRRLAEQTPFSGRCPWFAGDDRTDEDAIAAVQALGGWGVHVGPGETAARYRLAGVAEVHRWLDRSRRALREQAA